jgi:hypothetical protein
MQACPHVSQQLNSDSNLRVSQPTFCMQEAFGPCTAMVSALRLLQRIAVWLYPA